MTTPVITTHVSKALWDEHIIFGKKLFEEIVPAGLGRQVALVIGARALTDEDVALFEKVIACICLPDPNIWPLRVARFVASYGRFTPGLAAGLLFFESDRVGSLITADAARWQVKLAAEVGDDITLASVSRAAEKIFAGEKAIAGFGVPFRDEDERVLGITPHVEGSKSHRDRRYWRMFQHLVTYVKETRGVAPNFSGAGAALLLDLGFAPDDAAPIVLLACHLAQIPNALEGARQQSPIVQEIPREHIRYDGPAPRVSPRARLARSA